MRVVSNYFIIEKKTQYIDNMIYLYKFQDL